jgi:hypothetical protein
MYGWEIGKTKQTRAKRKHLGKETDDSISDSESEEDDIQNETAESDVTSEEGETAA